MTLNPASEYLSDERVAEIARYEFPQASVDCIGLAREVADRRRQDATIRILAQQYPSEYESVSDILEAEEGNYGDVAGAAFDLGMETALRFVLDILDEALSPGVETDG